MRFLGAPQQVLGERLACYAATAQGTDTGLAMNLIINLDTEYKYFICMTIMKIQHQDLRA